MSNQALPIDLLPRQAHIPAMIERVYPAERFRAKMAKTTNMPWKGRKQNG